jgi:formamidopyrimidine-DNA glycosylase
VPELPDVVVYLEALERRVVGHPLQAVEVRGISVLRSFDPPIHEAHGRTVVATRRLGKRLVLELDGGLFLVVHLMISGRLYWKDDPKAKIPAKVGVAALRFEHGTLLLNEVATKKRARIWLVRGEDALLAEHDRGGFEPLTVSLEDFTAQLRSTSRTLKRALTDPTAFSGIGNAFSDEILLRARLSPVKRSGQLDDAEMTRLYEAVRSTLTDWLERLRAEVGDGWPEKVTAFRPDFGVHGKFGQPCPVCGTPVQRIVYAENEVNYCPSCQTEGRVLADRSLSRLLKEDWPRTIEELEGFRVGG